MTDRLMRALDTLVAGWARVASGSPVRPVDPVDREVLLVVDEIMPAARDVVAITLRSDDGADLPRWHPGAHVDLVLPSGRIRQYSLCGDPDDRATYRVAVRRLPEGGGGSLEVHSVGVGARVRARGPRNAFPFAYPHLARRDIAKVAFIGAGIGITALLPMIRAAAEANVAWTLTYVGRDRAGLPFLDELALLGGDVRVLLGHPAPEEVLAPVDAATSVYFCGPASFLTTIQAELTRHPHAGFHFERFAPAPVVEGRAFRLRLTDSGLELNVPPDSSALSVVRDALPGVSYSCQQGYCGTCRVDVVSGEPQRRGTAAFLADDARPTMLICVDRAETDTLSVRL